MNDNRNQEVLRLLEFLFLMALCLFGFCLIISKIDKQIEKTEELYREFKKILEEKNE